MLTKLDIMDRGTDASAVLRNEAVPLRLGYIVSCRPAPQLSPCACWLAGSGPRL